MTNFVRNHESLIAVPDVLDSSGACHRPTVGFSQIDPAWRVDALVQSMHAAGNMKPLEIKDCPLANLTEKMAGRWGASSYTYAEATADETVGNGAPL